MIRSTSLCRRPLRGGDPHITEPAAGLHGEQRPQMLLPGEEIVDLQQIEARHAPESAEGFKCSHAFGLFNSNVFGLLNAAHEAWTRDFSRGARRNGYAARVRKA